MLTEPPCVALVRTSTYTLRPQRPGWIDLTTVYKQPLTSTGQPGLIDLTTANGESKSPSGQGPGRPLHTKAIYEIVEDRLTYCVAPPGQPRPTELGTKKGDRFTLVSLKRQPYQ
jgi:hypothetical protein